jgi:hypothetical protein
MGANGTMGTVVAKLTLDDSQFDAKMKASGATATASGRAREKAAKLAAEAEALSAKLAGDAVDQQTLRVIAARKKEAAAYADMRKAQQLSKAGYEGEEQAARTLAAAMQRLAVAKAEVSSASVEHAAVSQMQATSAFVRSLDGNPGIRSVERFLTTIPGIGKALMAAFPVVGAAAFGAVLVDMGVKVAEFIKKVSEMPDTIRRSFESLHLSVMASNDQLRLTNDELQNAINKLQGRAQNDLALELDETRIKADDLAKSLEEDAKRVKDLLAANNISQLAGLLGQAPTASVTGSVNSYQQKFSDIGYARAQAAQSGDTEGVAAKDRELAYVRKQALDWAQDQLNVRSNQQAVQRLATGAPGGGIVYQGRTYQDFAGDQTANKNVLQGFRTTIQDSQDREQLTQNNGDLNAIKKNEEEKKAAAEQAKQAAAERLRNLEANLAAEKQVRGPSIQADYEYWQQKQAMFATGSEQYNSIVQKQAELAVEGAKQAHEKIAQFQEQQKRLPSVAEGSDIVARSSADFQRQAVQRGQVQTQDNGESNQLAILAARNEARQREAELTDAAGHSMSRYAAALELARVHATEFEKEMEALESIRSQRALQQQTDPTRENGKALAEAQSAIVEAQAKRQLQVTQDNVATNGRDSSGLVGATDALEDFVKATRDSATELRNLTTTVLNSVNSEVVRAISTRGSQRQGFTDLGAGVFRSAAGTALQKGEGSILSAVGLGGLTGKKPVGTAGDPIHVMVANLQAFQGGLPQLPNLQSGLDTPLSNVPFTSLLPGGGGSGSSPSVGSMLGTALSLIPGFASGGMIDPNQWAIVGEEGPELFHSGGGGTIVPNDKIGGIGGGGDTHVWNIDARYATDPAQVQAQIMAAAPHIAAAAVKAGQEQRMRMPPSRRS